MFSKIYEFSTEDFDSAENPQETAMLKSIENRLSDFYGKPKGT